MKGSPAVPGGSLEGKPTWSSTIGCLTTSAFLCVVRRAPAVSLGTKLMSGFASGKTPRIAPTVMTLDTQQGACCLVRLATSVFG